MAALAVPNIVDDQTERVIPERWQWRQASNWMESSTTGNSTHCIDDNYGCVGVFSKNHFAASGKHSFLFTVAVNNSLNRARIGIVEKSFPQSRNRDLRKHKEYGLFSSPGNSFIGEDPNKFNLAIDLTGAVFVNGSKEQQGKSDLQCNTTIQVRLNIQGGDAKFICPALWGVRTQHIDFRGPLRVGIVSRQGFAFELFAIEDRFTLQNEIPRGINLVEPEAQQFRLAKARCDKITDKIRVTTASTRYNIIVLGAYGTGKSSLINHLISAFSDFDDRPKRRALTSSSTDDQTTSEVLEYQLPGTNLFLVDSVGIAFDKVSNKSFGMNYGQKVFDDLLRGNISVGYRASNLEPQQMSSRDRQMEIEGLIPDGRLDIDRMNHGAIVVEAATNSAARDEQYAAIKAFRSRHRGYPAVGVVTKLDVNKREAEFSMEKLFTGANLGEEFDEIRQRMEMVCFPVRCYTEMDRRQNIMYNLLAIEALDSLFEEMIPFRESSERFQQRDEERATQDLCG